MTIANLFSKNLARPINGVVKADQKDDATVWQELDEYVVTCELSKHFRRFFDGYQAGRDNPNDPTLKTRMGVWVSGFFGSGKSHFIKILSYLLANRLAHHDGVDRRAIEFFQNKLEEDPMLFSDIRRAVTGESDVILFNIDSKADSKAGRDAILSVFMRVFNEMQGFSGEFPHIAEMERQLKQRGALEKFHAAFLREAGKPWEEERDAYLFLGDKVTMALAAALEMSQSEAQNWFDKAEAQYKLSVDGFAKRVKEFVDTKPADYRLVFLVDEIGQFIGADTHLMLSLQTITEELGVQCGGKAWVIVTSQEDIDAVLGEVRAGKANDFSKIQGRFNTRLSLSSSNTDEVIQARLLEKTPAARVELTALFKTKGDVLRNQLSFRGNKSTYKTYRDEEDFIRSYPFAPYHFQLLQNIFELVRKVGATGTHLAKGERSMLDAFQTAARQVADRSVGALVPLHRFYPSIESFLEGVVKRTIDQVDSNPQLRELDKQMLQTLFLIRYVDTFEPNIDNLVTLFLDEVDADRLALKRQLQESLDRLESETLINRNGDLYYFLTNEEVDVSREIKRLELGTNEPVKLLGELIFDETFKGDSRYTYPQNKRNFSLNRLLDGHAHGGKVDNDLTLEVVSPLNDDWGTFKSDMPMISRSAQDGGRAVLRLPDNPELDQELGIYKRTEKYIKDKNGPTASTTMKRILDERADENRGRRDRLINLVKKMLTEADVFVAGNKQESKGAPDAIRDEALRYLIANTFPKLTFLPMGKTEAGKEIASVLHSSDVADLGLEIETSDAKAVAEVRDYITMMTDTNKQLVLNEVIDRFGKRPWGWPEWDVALVIAKLVRSGEVGLVMEGQELSLKESVDPMTKSAKWRTVKLLKKKKLDDALLKKTQTAYKQIFGKQAPTGEGELQARLKEQLVELEKICNSYHNLASKGGYPGLETIQECLKLLKPLLQARTNTELFESFVNSVGDLDGLYQDVQELQVFFEKQDHVWKKLVGALDGPFKDNDAAIEDNPEARRAVVQLKEIRNNKRPFGQLSQVEGLVKVVENFLDSYIAETRNQVSQDLDAVFGRVELAVQEAQASSDLLTPLKALRDAISSERSIPKLHYLPNQAVAIENKVLAAIKKPDPVPVGGGGVPKPEPKIFTVKPRSLSKKSYLATEDEAREFLKALESSIMDAIGRQELVRID